MLTVEFLWCGGVGGGVCTVIFVSNPTTVLKLCCVVVGVVTKNQLSSSLAILLFCWLKSWWTASVAP